VTPRRSGVAFVGIRSIYRPAYGKGPVPITTLFLDIGVSCSTTGGIGQARQTGGQASSIWSGPDGGAASLTFETHEEGKLTFEEYLGRVVFYQKRTFTRAEFRRFMFAQSKTNPEMIALIGRLKTRYGLKIAVVSNEGARSE